MCSAVTIETIVIVSVVVVPAVYLVVVTVVVVARPVDSVFCTQCLMLQLNLRRRRHVNMTY